MAGWKGHWVRAYRARMALYLERCRNCGRLPGQKGGGKALTFDHLVPKSQGGAWSIDNATILCLGCNASKADAPAPQHWRSLAQEEAAAPPELRWSTLPVLTIPTGPVPEPRARPARRVLRDVAAEEREQRKRAERWRPRPAWP